MKQLLLFTLVLMHFAGGAQNKTRHQVAVFTPLYLDSVYDAAGQFRFEKNDFPRYVIAGLDFYNGAMAAIDSLEKRGAPLEFFLYDSRGRQSLQQILSRSELKKVEMIIGQTNAAETRTLAEAAQQRKIPFISATLPNHAGVGSNPYFVILNSTLQSHVEAIGGFLQKYHTQDKIIVFRKPGAQEDQLKQDLTEYTKNSTAGALSIRYVDLPENFTSAQLAGYMDSTRRNLCIAGSLDDNFGSRLVTELDRINTVYPTRVIGMPTWDRISFSKVPDLEIVYTSPFYYNKSTALEAKLSDDYNSNVSTRPTDMFFRSYETVLRFALLLLDTQKDVSSSLGRKGNTVFTQFDIQPVFKDHTTMNLDYFENRHLYFIKVFGGVKNIIN